MYSNKLVVAVTALLLRTTSADQYSGSGNVDLEINSDGPLYVVLVKGDVAPWDVLGTLNDHCSGETCSTDPWTMATDLCNDAAGTNNPQNINEGMITVTVADATISTGDDLAGMIEALQDLSKQPQITNTTTEYYCSGDDSGAGPSGKMKRFRFARDVTCNEPGHGDPITQYSTASTYYIRVNDDNGDLRSELRVGIQAGVVDDALSMEICTDLTTAGSAVAGLFTGGAAAAAGFTLAGLACGSL